MQFLNLRNKTTCHKLCTYAYNWKSSETSDMRLLATLISIHKKELNMNQNQVNYTSNEKLSQFKSLTSSEFSNTFDNVITKLITERGNSNLLYTANKSTPLNRAIFVCKLNTPKESNQTKTVFIAFLSNEFNQTNFGLVESLSMVAFSGQRLIVGCIPCITVFHPAKRYRQTVESEVIAPQNLYTELLAMFYKFLIIGKNRLKISILASNEKEARSLLSLTSTAVLIARTPAKGGLYA